MDKNYNKSIKLHCITCGDDSSFECNDNKSNEENTSSTEILH